MIKSAWAGTAKAILLIDTSVLLEILRVPYESDRHDEAKADYESYQHAGAEMRLPMATVLETGSHVRKIDDGKERRRCAHEFDKILRATVAGQAPWTFRDLRWTGQMLTRLLDGEGHHYPMADSFERASFEMGDLAIVEEWRETRANLSSTHVDVGVWTYDVTLKAVIETLKGESL